ncbi:unnamed protein product, partial [Fusarium fujikuroi]
MSALLWRTSPITSVALEIPLSIGPPSLPRSAPRNHTSSNDWRKLTVHNYTRLFHGGNAYENLGMTCSVRMLFTFHSRKDEQGRYRGGPTISAGSMVQYYV